MIYHDQLAIPLIDAKPIPLFITSLISMLVNSPSEDVKIKHNAKQPIYFFKHIFCFLQSLIIIYTALSSYFGN